MARKSKTVDSFFSGGLALGCLVQVVLLAVMWFVVTEDYIVSVMAYAILLAVPAILLRKVLLGMDWLGEWGSRLLGPGFFALALLLSRFCPLQTTDEAGEPVPVTPGTIADGVAEKVAGALSQDGDGDGEGAEGDGEEDAETPHWEKKPPPGVRYVAADPECSLDDALKELDELIGLGEVKAEVAKFAKFIQVARLRQAEGLKVAPIAYHMVFTGNPGTGKTTVARIMAKIYRALGVVSNGHLVETDRGGLIAEYVGQTAVKTGAVIDFALDGVLFIDEAYSITDGGTQGYGGECIATLLKRMEDDRDRLVVIVAGYPEEMKRFIDSNPGLESRFTRYIHFPDYTAEELAEIFRMNARKNEYVLSADVEQWIDPAMEVWTKDRDRKFGNGRYVRNLFEKSVERQAMRVSEIENPTREQLMTLTMQDVGIALKDPDASDED